MKRKQASPSDSDLPSTSSSSPPHKRRRPANLEYGFANLSLNNVEPPLTLDPLPPAFDSSIQSTSIRPDDLVMDIDTTPAATQEVPCSLSSTSPPVHDVKMKFSSWYEPEPDRIVITSLDSASSSEDEEEEPEIVEVSPALIKHLKARALDPNVLPQQQQQPSQALVLFRPLVPPTSTLDEDDGYQASDEDDSDPGTVLKEDVDSMDIEI